MLKMLRFRLCLRIIIRRYGLFINFIPHVSRSITNFPCIIDHFINRFVSSQYFMLFLTFQPKIYFGSKEYIEFSLDFLFILFGVL